MTVPKLLSLNDYNKGSLSSSEWTAAIKLNANYANLRGVPTTGIKKLNQNNLCRRCKAPRKESETIKHVLGSCDFGQALRIKRHHYVKLRLASILEKKGYVCFDEAYSRDGDSRSRYIDIVAFDPKSDRAYLIDPTVRYESNSDVAEEVRKEKAAIYDSCGSYLGAKYESKFGKRRFEVIGLWFGARGTISRQLVDVFERFDLDKVF
ncbi:hypothetical protein [Clostridioides difficile]|uniref:hypothetical protein n=1 Tax=Clostridioides difficile TaxID=1496 RepID=UPI0013EF738F|nr:hypothetical protein [Clostridioides difficile]